MKKLWRTVREVVAAEATRALVKVVIAVLAALGVVDVAQGTALRADAPVAAVHAAKP